MTNERVNNPGANAAVSYKDALLGRNKRARHSSDPVVPDITQRKDRMIQLKSSLRDVLRENPDGINLPHLRQLCPLLVDPEILRFPHPSIRHLLASLNDVVKLQGIGVQTLALPVPAEELNIGS